MQAQLKRCVMAAVPASPAAQPSLHERRPRDEAIQLRLHPQGHSSGAYRVLSCTADARRAEAARLYSTALRHGSRRSLAGRAERADGLCGQREPRGSPRTAERGEH